MTYIISRRFNGEIYRLRVGFSEQIFQIHQRILEESPVLKRMIHGGFAESISKDILLPDDDEDAFGRIIEYLYGDSINAFVFRGLDDSETLKKLAGIYILADKYQLALVQEVVISALEKVSKVDMIAFFKTGCHIYQNIRDSDTLFSTYFKREAGMHLKIATTTEDIHKISELVESGGNFAKAVVQIQAELYEQERRTLSTQIRNLEDALTNKEKVLNRAQANISRIRNKLFRHTGKLERLH